MLSSRVFMSLAGAAVIAMLTAGTYLVAFDPLRKVESYCALMPDTVGLYTGNHVTVRGMPVGDVTAITPQGGTVRVDFTVDADYPLGEDVSATTESDTIVADRQLALIDTGAANTRWDHSHCITKTLTPKSMTETLTALADLASETLGPDPGHADALQRGLTALDAATAGTGPQINEIITKLGTALNSPDAAIGHLAGVIDALSSLAHSVSGQWSDIKSMLLRLTSVLDDVNNGLFSTTIDIIDGFQRVLPMLNDITTLFGDPIFAVLDATVPLARFAGANVATLRDIITMIPNITSAFTTVLDPATGAPGLTYASPRVALPAAAVDRVCAAVDALAPGRCGTTSDGLTGVALVPLVLGLAGAR
ncbi:MlaD family protein [Nocardia sp. NPDC006630]|uniref:MlaD family protein n=1 Tax=Nocardia sp. NPDC006630 TaxID=3157181 RepID=UPI0033B15517